MSKHPPLNTPMMSITLSPNLCVSFTFCLFSFSFSLVSWIFFPSSLVFLFSLFSSSLYSLKIINDWFIELLWSFTKFYNAFSELTTYLFGIKMHTVWAKEGVELWQKHAQCKRRKKWTVKMGNKMSFWSHFFLNS